jgi:hypothetical protein
VLLVGCGDETRTGTKDLTTGAVSWSFGKQRSSRYKMRVVMARGADGGWRVAGYQSVPAADPVARECR